MRPCSVVSEWTLAGRSGGVAGSALVDSGR